MNRYMSWIIVPGILLALLGGMTLLGASSDETKSTDTPLALFVTGLVLVLVGLVWQAELRRRDQLR